MDLTYTSGEKDMLQQTGALERGISLLVIIPKTPQASFFFMQSAGNATIVSKQRVSHSQWPQTPDNMPEEKEQ